MANAVAKAQSEAGAAFAPAKGVTVLLCRSWALCYAQLYYCAVYPPSIEWTLPVMKAARSLSK